MSAGPSPVRASALDAELRRLLGRWTSAAPPVRSAGAAVTVVLREGRTELEMLLLERTVRADDLASGQVSLPGGRVDRADATLTDTALRELREEVGLGAADLADPPTYVLTQSAPVFGLDVAVFAAPLGPRSSGPRVESRQEVAHVFWLPRSAFSQPKRVIRQTMVGPREVDALVFDSHVIWGFTLRVLNRFFRNDDVEPPPHPI
ncbi:MAG: CoA pyrophosphatase [Thermoplasmata archaeon]|nr:CoA pyrophosphatase [Thermoplasmata archaeon]